MFIFDISVGKQSVPQLCSLHCRVTVGRGIGKDLEGNCSILTEGLTRMFPVVAEENVKLSGKQVSRSEFEPVESLRVLTLNLFSGCESVLVGSGVPRRGEVQTPPPPEIPKVLQNRAKLNPIVKTVKNC